MEKTVLQQINNHLLRRSATSNQSGQIAVVVLLIMVVLLVMGLSLASRTTQETFLSQQSSETARVWNAAESGAEQAISSLSTGATPEEAQITGQPINDATVDVVVTSQNTAEALVKQLGTLTINLDTPSSLPTLDIQWGLSQTPSNRASLLVSVYYEDSSGITRVVHYTLGTSHNRNDGFDMPTINIASGKGFSLVETDATNAAIILPDHTTLSSLIPEDADPLFARIKPIYADATISVSGSNLPTQSYLVRSEAENASTNATGREVRVVEVDRSLPAAPSILDYALYSGGSITKQ